MSDLLERLGEEAPTERLREQLARQTRAARRTRSLSRAAALLVAALALAAVVRLALPERDGSLSDVGTYAEASEEDVFRRLDAVVSLLARDSLATDDVAFLVATAHGDPSVNVRLLSIDALSSAGVSRSTLEQIGVEGAPAIVRARLEAALASPLFEVTP